MPSSLLAFLMCDGATSTVPDRRRLRLVDFASARWRLPVCSRRSLPEPVIRTRFFIPEWVFIFGMAMYSWFLSLTRSGEGSGLAGRSAPSLRIEVVCRTLRLLGGAGGPLGLVLLQLLGTLQPLGLLVGLVLGVLLGLLGFHVHARLGLLLVRSEHHDHVPAVLTRRRLDEAELADVLGQPLQEPEPQLGAGLLASAAHAGDLDLVTGTQEPDDVTLLGLVVVRVDLRSQLHLFDDRVGLVPA